MKKLFLVATMLFTVSFMFGNSQPEYDVGPDYVKVLVQDNIQAVSVEIATVDLNTLEVKNTHGNDLKASVSVVKFSNSNVVGVKKRLEDCEYLYIATRADNKLSFDVPIRRTDYEITDLTHNNASKIPIYLKPRNKYLFSSGGLPYSQC